MTEKPNAPHPKSEPDEPADTAEQADEAAEQPYSSKEEAEIAARLESLGYM